MIKILVKNNGKQIVEASEGSNPFDAEQFAYVEMPITGNPLNKGDLVKGKKLLTTNNNYSWHFCNYYSYR